MTTNTELADRLLNQTSEALDLVAQSQQHATYAQRKLMRTMDALDEIVVASIEQVSRSEKDPAVVEAYRSKIQRILLSLRE